MTLVPLRALNTGGSQLNSENQKRILDTVSRVFSGVANALGRESYSYEEGICFLRDYGKKTVFELLLAMLAKVLPVVGQEHNLTPEVIPAFLDKMDTREHAEAFLAGFPDPDSAELDRYIREVILFLPSIRKILIPIAKQLPPDPGGHPRKIPVHDEPMVRAEVAQLFNDGYSFPAAKKEVARRRKASLSTVERICRKGNLKLGVSEVGIRV